LYATGGKLETLAMQLPVVTGLIDRRILLNYRVDPAVLARLVPRPFRPKLIHGYGIAGVCLIRLKQLRPRGWPAALGFSSENAAHRIAVTWERAGRICEGVYIPRRDTNSRWNTLVGGRLFPGVHHLARFDVTEGENHLDIQVQSDDGRVQIEVKGQISSELPSGSIFQSMREASAYFETGAVGYSATADRGRLDGLELRCRTWKMEALSIHRARSSFFEDAALFPAGSAQLDCALLMRGIEHEWHACETMTCASVESRSASAAAV